MLQWCIWRSSKVIGNYNIRYNAHEFVLVFHCNDGHIAVSSPSGRKSILGTFWAQKSCLVVTILVRFFLLSNISMEAKSYTWYYIINRQRQNAASLTPIPQTQWLLSPKSTVKIGLIPPFLKLPLPYFPQLPSKIYLGTTQMYGIQRKQWRKWNIGAHNTKSLQ